MEPDSSTTIQFYNPFINGKQFQFYTNSNAFTIKEDKIEIQGRTMYNVNVYSQTLNSDNLQWKQNNHLTGKLVIACEDQNLKHLQWIYYLQINSTQ